MNKFLLLLLLLLIACFLTLAKSFDEVCYGDLGCFDNKPPFGNTTVRPIGVVPEPPEKVDTRFVLHTRLIANISISYDDISEHYNPKLPTKIIIHGFMQHGNKRWISDMKNAFLRTQDLNVILADYSKGNGFPYTQAVANARMAGAQTAKLIKEIVIKTGAKLRDFHLIGHSLGAHVAGYAGERLKNITGNITGRITGLDPAGPYFEFADSSVRLDKTDAEFVDIMHTDGSSNFQLGLGLIEPSAHADFYPNGGKNQPKCAGLSDKIITGLLNLVTLNIDDLEDVSGCSHVSAYKFFTDSIENKVCQYISYPCNSIDEFNDGNCLKCSDKGCNRMGYWASPNNDIGNLYLTTQDADKFPFCAYQYQMKLLSNSLENLKQARGKLSVQFLSGNVSTDWIVFENSNKVLKPNVYSSHLVTIKERFDKRIDKIVITYQRTSNIINSWLYDKQWSFKSAELFDGLDQSSSKFCISEENLNVSDRFEMNAC